MLGCHIHCHEPSNAARLPDIRMRELVSVWSHQSSFAVNRRNELWEANEKGLSVGARQDYLDPGLSRLLNRAAAKTVRKANATQSPAARSAATASIRKRSGLRASTPKAEVSAIKTIAKSAASKGKSWDPKVATKSSNPKAAAKAPDPRVAFAKPGIVAKPSTSAIKTSSKASPKANDKPRPAGAICKRAPVGSCFVLPSSGNNIPLTSQNRPATPPPRTGNTASRPNSPPVSDLTYKNPQGNFSPPGTDLEAQKPQASRSTFRNFIPSAKSTVSTVGAGLDAISSAIPGRLSLDPTAVLFNVAKGVCKLGAELCKIAASKMEKRAVLVRALVRRSLVRRGLDEDMADVELKMVLARRWHVHLNQLFLDDLVWA